MSRGLTGSFSVCVASSGAACWIEEHQMFYTLILNKQINLTRPSSYNLSEKLLYFALFSFLGTHISGGHLISPIL